MLKKGSKLYSILTGTCPKCHNEKMYINGNPYILGQTMKMHDHCSHCGTKYKMEPNFFFGSVHVSYGVGLITCVVVFAIAIKIFNTSVETAFLATLVCLILLFPIITRFSRNIYINLFMSYDKALDKRS